MLFDAFLAPRATAIHSKFYFIYLVRIAEKLVLRPQTHSSQQDLGQVITTVALAKVTSGPIYAHA